MWQNIIDTKYMPRKKKHQLKFESWDFDFFAIYLLNVGLIFYAFFCIQSSSNG